MKYQRWDTVISNCRGLNFKRLVDQGGLLLFEIEDEHNELYEVVLKSDYDFAYKLHGEDFEPRYDVEIKVTGWTFIIEENIPFAKLREEVIDHNKGFGLEPYAHYAIYTYDTCLEIISNTPPIVRKVN
ncbi:hypothetical protein [Mariprofundus ferrooxydans]|uniref:hypothetical protein n=1 Tax=Mariprofundus ferrooxydans TaxID=314344 RepID=UPI0014320E36|nr:hypothetical protein [Mariprofundus ferrooxydans]